MVQLNAAMGVLTFKPGAVFGAYTVVGNGVADDSAAMQAAIDEAALFGAGDAGCVWVCPAYYVLDNVTLKAKVDIIGTVHRGVRFISKPGSINPMFKLPNGPVFNCRYENFICYGVGGGVDQHCFHLRALSNGTNGGIWWSMFRNISTYRFGGAGLWLRGGPGGFVLPNQFISFENCQFMKPQISSTYSRSVLITGQTGQISFDGECQFEGPGLVLGGTNIEISPEYINGSVVGGQLQGGAPNGGTNAPYNIKFHGGTIQSCEQGAYVYNSSNVIFHGCYFENVKRSVRGVGSTTNLILDSCHFTNAASDGVNCGISVATPAVISGTNQFVAGDRVMFASTIALPTGLVAGTAYYVSADSLSGFAFQVSATAGGPSIATTLAGQGVHSFFAGTAGPGGYAVQFGTGSSGAFSNNDVMGNMDRPMSNSATHTGVIQHGNQIISTALNTTKAVNYTLGKGVAAGVISVDRVRAVNITTNGAAINIINSRMIAGDRVLLKCGVAGCTLDETGVTSGNNGAILLGHWTTLTLALGDAAEFEYSDIFEKWILTSTTGVLA